MSLIASESKMSLWFEPASPAMALASSSGGRWLHWANLMQPLKTTKWVVVLGTDGWWVKARAMVNWSL